MIGGGLRLSTPKACRRQCTRASSRRYGTFAPKAADKRVPAACTFLAFACSACWDSRQTGPDMPIAPMVRPVKSAAATAMQRTSRLNSPSSYATPVRLTSASSRNRAGASVMEFLVDGLSSTRSKNRLSWSSRSDARITLPRAVQCAGRQRKQRATDAVALGVWLLPNVAERHQRLGEVEGGRVVQAEALAQISEPDAVAIARNLLEDGEGATERLHPDALPVRRIVIDIGGQRPRRRSDLWGRRNDRLATRLGLGRG